MTGSTDTQKSALLDAALPHVAFDGWSQVTFDAAAKDAKITTSAARDLCPKGALDLAIAYHQRGDDLMAEKLQATDLSGMRFRDKVAFAVRVRLEVISDKEAVRRGSALFALPMNAGDGAKLIWGTADCIWTTLGDTSTDINWYTKRATLSGVYGACALFWLGDTSADHADTAEFIDRRIDNVMQFEKAKAQARKSPVLGKLMQFPNWLTEKIERRPPDFKSQYPGFVPADAPRDADEPS